MLKASFVHYSKFSSPAEWISLSGKHQRMNFAFMPVWSKKKHKVGGVSKISLSSRTVSLVKNPWGYEHILGAKVEYAIAAMREISEVEISNPIEIEAESESDKPTRKVINRIFLNIRSLEKKSNPLIAVAERVTAYNAFDIPFTAAKTVLQLGLTVNKIQRDFGLLNPRIRLTLTSYKQDDTIMVIEREFFTFGDLADIIEKLSQKKRSHNDIRLLLDELIRNGVNIISAI
ncbi:hypothetical protein [Pelagibaculum spongiae]|uniref:Uncharacterized protein n=1 Tax=Pelagibaculum spongiae TaxID=2080658 RepID=A0A2V1GQX4_9GAMM|nr:hypothetical protein [Pelagibaculum spongiae]PVZ66391.1 hypothetical protein DC094_16995 [Pelagibaculum spongiae]